MLLFEKTDKEAEGTKEAEVFLYRNNIAPVPIARSLLIARCSLLCIFAKFIIETVT